MKWMLGERQKAQGLRLSVCPSVFTGPEGGHRTAETEADLPSMWFCSSCTAHSPCGGSKNVIEYYTETFTMERDQHKQPFLLKCNTLITARCYAKSKWIVCQINQHLVRRQDENNNGQSVIESVLKFWRASLCFSVVARAQTELTVAKVKDATRQKLWWFSVFWKHQLKDNSTCCLCDVMWWCEIPSEISH